MNLARPHFASELLKPIPKTPKCSTIKNFVGSITRDQNNARKDSTNNHLHTIGVPKTNPSAIPRTMNVRKESSLHQRYFSPISVHMRHKGGSGSLQPHSFQDEISDNG